MTPAINGWFVVFFMVNIRARMVLLLLISWLVKAQDKTGATQLALFDGYCATSGLQYFGGNG